MDRTREQPRDRCHRRSKAPRTEDHHWMTLTDVDEALMHTPARAIGVSSLHDDTHQQDDQIEAQPSASCCADASACFCLCPLAHADRQLDQFGHHPAACSEAGVLGTRGFPLECVAAQVCREAGARVTPNAFVRDLDVGAFNALDGRRIEVIVDGLTLWQGAQLAINTTLVSPLRWDGSPRRGATRRAGCGSWRKCATGQRPHSRSWWERVGRAHLVVLAAETEGRWSDETPISSEALRRRRQSLCHFCCRNRVKAA